MRARDRVVVSLDARTARVTAAAAATVWSAPHIASGRRASARAAATGARRHGQSLNHFRTARGTSTGRGPFHTCGALPFLAGRWCRCADGPAIHVDPRQTARQAGPSPISTIPVCTRTALSSNKRSVLEKYRGAGEDLRDEDPTAAERRPTATLLTKPMGPKKCSGTGSRYRSRKSHRNEICRDPARCVTGP